LKKDSFYFLHTPKTAGRFFTHNIVVPLDPILLKNGVHNFYDRNTYVAHQHWAPFITDSTYIVNLFRDPIPHTVSAYCHFTMLSHDAQRKVPVGDERYSKHSMFDWLDKYEHSLSNFQSKSLLLSELGNNVKTYFDSQNMIECVPTTTAVMEKINKVSLFLNSEDLAFSNVKKIHNKILDDFSIPRVDIKHSFQKHSNYWNPDSTRILNSLNDADKERILKWANIDAEIFHSNGLFFNIKEYE
jgi:hypothetical protein